METNDKIEIADEDTKESDFSPDELADDSIDWKAKAEELKGIAKRRATQLKKLKDADNARKTAADAAKIAVDIVKDSKAPPPKTGELDETQLDYLDLKGISEDDDIKIIERHVQRTGETVRQALKDEYVVAKLATSKAEREVKAAIPSGTKRSGQVQGTDLALALAKYEQSGRDPSTLPTDFYLRSKVINSLVDKEKSNKPSWQ